MTYQKTHMGEKIAEVCHQKRISGTSLGRKMSMSEVTGRFTLKQAKVPLDKLLKVSIALKHDFFQYLLPKGQVSVAATELESLQKAATPKPDKPKPAFDLEKENEYLKEKVAHLEEINQLLRLNAKK